MTDIPYRIGLGSDRHRLEAGRPLILGGVEIPGDLGAVGHSDADALLHAITDAILGAAGLGDIGEHFPDTDEQYRGADSAVLLRAALDEVEALGWRIGNLDAVVHLQAPKLAPHKHRIRARIAEICRMPEDRVNLKAKTGEKVGPVGQGEAIDTLASVLLVRNLA